MVIQGDFVLGQDFIDELHGGYFPWYYQPMSSSSTFPLVVHSVIQRGDGGTDPVVNSTIWYTQIYPALVRFTKQHGLELDEVQRCAINMTLASSGQFEVGDKHIDQVTDHYVLVAYLNDCSGDTVIYDKEFVYGDPTSISVFADDNTTPIKASVAPKLNTCVCFDGKYYHANTFPQLGERRIVCVINFTVKK
jgi:hypothetical protein